MDSIISEARYKRQLEKESQNLFAEIRRRDRAFIERIQRIRSMVELDDSGELAGIEAQPTTAMGIRKAVTSEVGPSQQEHLRQKDSDEPIADLRSQALARKCDLVNASVGLTVNAGAPQGARIEPLLQHGPNGGDLESSWLIKLGAKSRLAVVRDKGTGSLLAATRVEPRSDLIGVLRGVLISRGRPGSIICDPEVVSVIRDWASIHGVAVVTRRAQRQRRTALLVDVAKKVQGAKCGVGSTKRQRGILVGTAEAHHKIPDLAKKTVAREMPAEREINVAWTG
jgi:hypothetical protein